MKNMTLGAFAFASALALASAPGYALSFDFSFSNVFGDVNGTVTGLIEGLTDNTTSAATDVIVESYPAGVGGVPPAPIVINGVPFGSTTNDFTVANGSITSAFFSSGFDKPLCLSFAHPSFSCANGAFFGFLDKGFVEGPVSFTPAAVPGPIAGAGLPGLIFAGGACSWMLAYVWLARMLRIHSLYNSVQTRRQAMPTSKRL